MARWSRRRVSSPATFRRTRSSPATRRAWSARAISAEDVDAAAARGLVELADRARQRTRANDHGRDRGRARANRRGARARGPMSRPDLRLERLFGDGATAFRAAFDLVPDPVGVLWAIRDRVGAIADFETGYSNPAMARMIGVPIEASIGRRLLQEAPDFGEDEDVPAHAQRARERPARGCRGDGGVRRGADRARARGLPAPRDPVRRPRRAQPRDRRDRAAADGGRTARLREGRGARPARADHGRRLLHRAARIAGSSNGRDAENEELLERVRQTHARARSLVDGVLEYARSGTGLAADAVDTGGAGGRRRGVAGQRRRATARAARDRGAPRSSAATARSSGASFRTSWPTGSSSTPTSRLASPSRPSGTTATWLFNVRDNGVGVPPELGDEIFSMFKRAHGEEVEGLRHRPRRLPQDRRGARRRHLGRARGRRRHRHALHRSRP